MHFEYIIPIQLVGITMGMTRAPTIANLLYTLDSEVVMAAVALGRSVSIQQQKHSEIGSALLVVCTTRS